MKPRAFAASQRRVRPLTKQRVLRRLNGVLRGGDKNSPFTDLSARGGAAAINIFAATKADLPDFWKAVPECPPQKS